MSRTKINIPKRVLEKLYWEEGLSTIKIARIYSCDPMTVINRIRELAIPRKSASQARIRFPRANFSGNVTEKAYMLGMTDGDLNTYTLPGEQTVVARCHTTQEVQVVILEEVFSRYGRVSVSRSESNGFHVNCYLNRTFLFLVTEKKQMPCWLLSSNKTFQSYIAGYTDAEGNFILNQGRARFKIDSYDKKILMNIHDFLIRRGVSSILRRIAVAGSKWPGGKPINQDLWRINVNEAASLKLFIDMINPHLLHQTRKRQVELCLANIQQRCK